jgi:4-hydroxy-tetrahydrodipicolinate synthase
MNPTLTPAGGTAPGLPGLFPALMTPLDAQGEIDRERFVDHARSLLARGCTGLTPFGSTGEGPSFSLAERCAALEELVSGGVPAGCLLASTACAALPDAVSVARHAQEIGAWGVMVMPPFYFKGVPDDGVLAFFEQVLQACADRPLRVVLYHIPQVTAVPVAHGVVTELVRRHGPRIVAIKDSAGDLAHSVSLAQAFMPPLGVHVGHEPHLPEMARRGSRGAVSGLANFMPRTVRRLACEPEAPSIAADLARVEALLAVLARYPLFPALKAVMALQTGHAGWLRLRPPLQALDEPTCARLRDDFGPLALDPAVD